MKKTLFIISLTFLGFIFSCKNTNSSESTQQTESNSSEGESTENTTNLSTQEKAPTILYAWVDKLRIREQPTTKSEIVAEVKEGTSFTYLNEKTDYKERINLRGTLFNEPWLKIKTDGGKEGWVYGGAVKFYEPVVDANPSPYDKCFELKKNRKKKFKTCFHEVRAKQLKKDARYISQKKGSYSITLLTGKKIELKTDTIEVPETPHERSYIEYLPQVGFFVFRNQYHDGGDYSLINDKSGKETIIKGFPKLSPNSKNIISFSSDLTDGVNFNGIQIFGFPNGKFEKLLEKEFENMEPHTPKWIDNKTIEISMMPPSFDKETKPRNIKIIMNEKGDWEIKD